MVCELFCGEDFLLMLMIIIILFLWEIFYIYFILFSGFIFNLNVKIVLRVLKSDRIKYFKKSINGNNDNMNRI